jgi:hypothetical protein
MYNYFLSNDTYFQSSIENFIYVVRFNEPNEIYYIQALAGEDYGYDFCMRDDDGIIEELIVHTCPGQNEIVMTTQETFVIDNFEKVVVINNKSEHYKPHPNSLDHIECLLKKRGLLY